MTPRIITAGRNEPLGPTPASVKALARSRPFILAPIPAPVWPLRCADGRTWAEVKAMGRVA